MVIDGATVVLPSVADSSPYSPWEFLFTEAWVTHDKAHDIAQRRLDEWQRPHSLCVDVPPTNRPIWPTPVTVNHTGWTCESPAQSPHSNWPLVLPQTQADRWLRASELLER